MIAPAPTIVSEMPRPQRRVAGAARHRLGELVREARLARDLSPEAVAERAGVGASWYRWLEEGRDMGLSLTALRWISDALDLTPEQRAALPPLAGLEKTVALATVRAEPVPASLRRLLDGYPLYPAYITGKRLDVLAWNEACEALFRCSTIAPERRNSFVFLFTQPDVRKIIVNWEEQAQSALDELRAALDESPSDPWLGEVPAALAPVSAEFQELWSRGGRRAPRVDAGSANKKIFDKGSLGRLVFIAENLVPREAPDLCVRIYVPEESTRRRVQALLHRHRRDAAAKKKAGQYAVVRTIKEHLDACYREEVPLDELAALAGMKKFAMVRAFTAEVGFPPHSYQTLLRVHHARRLLLAGQSAGATATAVGFVDQSHLTRHFKRIEGITPGEYSRRTRTARV
ncbi:helix-turn-helix domain-containing protein [Pendulispora albinea]|uniref:Helix-turn-helix domain-containing protein n=1 Tax=Pendulispora albinea TaxID=2741071 RepID=A0ABZ2M1K7_9BACT